MNLEKTIIYLASQLAEAEEKLEIASKAENYWYEEWKKAKKEVDNLELLISNSSSVKKEGE